MEILASLIIGIIAGLLAGRVIEEGGFGLMGNLVIGVCGALVGGWISNVFGFIIPSEVVAASIAMSILGTIALFSIIYIFQNIKKHTKN